MEWYTLDDHLRRDVVIEGYESLIWTERYGGWGDFQIVITSSFNSRSIFKTGVNIAKRDSTYVMQVETVEDQIDEDGVKNLVISGRSYEKILDERIAMPSLTDLTTAPKWIITGTPGYIARHIFSEICVNGVLNANDTIPFYVAGTLLPSGNIAEPTEEVTIEFEPATVYYDIQKICEIWSLGFRFAKDGDTGNVYFEIYTGDDRTSKQITLPPVIFAIDMESIDKISSLKSIATFRTLAYVFAKNGAMAVYADGYDSSTPDSDRRILLVKADDLDIPAGPDLDAAMTQRGKEELAKCREIYAVDGEIPQYQSYVYGTDYQLGDLVEEIGPDGFSSSMIVTEQIFISDEEGNRSYPTLMLSAAVSPGSWRSRPVDEHWNDVPADEHWNDA
jgi:Siphovirus ReqiPepy6 Gp37-like protein